MATIITTTIVAQQRMTFLFFFSYCNNFYLLRFFISGLCEKNHARLFIKEGLRKKGVVITIWFLDIIRNHKLSVFYLRSISQWKYKQKGMFFLLIFRSARKTICCFFRRLETSIWIPSSKRKPEIVPLNHIFCWTILFFLLN